MHRRNSIGTIRECDGETKFKYPNSQVSKKMQPERRWFLLIFQLQVWAECSKKSAHEYWRHADDT